MEPVVSDAAAQPEAAAAEEQQPPQEEADENDVLVEKAMLLMSKITSNSDNPNPTVIHALSTLFEAQEARYMEDADPSATSNGRASHNVGRLGTLIRDNDEFFDLISSRFLTESRYSVSVQAATTRLLFSCSLTWTYPHVFEDEVLDKIRGWAMDETPRSSNEDRIWKNDTGKRKTSDSEMLRAYSTGLLAVCLTFGGQLVEDVLASGLSAKLMQYLRIRVLGESSTSQRDIIQLDNKSAYKKPGDEARGRLHQLTESSHLDVGILRTYPSERDRDNWIDDKPPNSMIHDIVANGAESEGEDKYNNRENRISKTKYGGKSHKEEDMDEDMREDSSKRRTTRPFFFKSQGKSRSVEGVSENEQVMNSPGPANRSGPARVIKERSARTQKSDAKKGFAGNIVDSFVLERDDTDDCFQNCKVGSTDITELVKKAVRAAEEEARTANAPPEAVKAAGDDAAEVVKTSAFEEYKKTNDEEAAAIAASRAASTVVDAANTVALSRSSINVDGDSGKSKVSEPETTDDTDEFTILGGDSLAKLRERFCIQCLVILGEYVEALGPVLHEKGVDVCLTLLQRSVKHKDASNMSLLLPDILRLICALTAHRMFAAKFIDHGGMGKLLAVPRNAHTFFGLSSCLFTIGSIQGIMERVCALPSNIVHQVVELALQLIECPRDQQARKNSALFFAAAFVFRAVIDAFDAQDGLQKLLSPLHDAASVRSGVASGGSISNPGGLLTDRSPAEVLTSLEKQIAYHTCVALRQYFRSHMLLLVDSIRPNKNLRSVQRNISNIRPANKPLDNSNEAMDALFRQIQKDRKLGPALARVRWPVVDKFLSSNGHTTMLELCQAPPVERYLHDLIQYALGVLHIVTLVPYSRKPILNATLSNDRVGIAVILDAVNGAGFVEPEIVEPALNLLINLVCPPPSISNKSSTTVPGQQPSSTQTGNVLASESRDRNTDTIPERTGEPVSVDRSVATSAVSNTPSVGNTSSQPSAPTVTSGLVGDRRISLGVGAGCAGLAAQLEQGYRQAREAVRANNGIKVLLQLLQPRMVTSPASLDCLRALTCRVLLGLARDDTIAHILTKLQVGKKLSELIRDSGSQTSGEQNRWQTELTQVTIELIGVVTNSGRASTLAASDAATPTLRRIERAAIAAATPISYHPRELLLLIHEHLQASGLEDSAATLLKEAQLTPFPSLASPSSLTNQVSGQEASAITMQWPSGRASCGFLSDKPKLYPNQDDSIFRFDSALSSSKKKQSKIRSKLDECPSQFNVNSNNASSQKASSALDVSGTLSAAKSSGNTDANSRTPILLPMKRKLTDFKEIGSSSSAKRLNTGDHILKSPIFSTPSTVRRSGMQLDSNITPKAPLPDIDENQLTNSHIGNDQQPSGTERLTLDSVVVQYLKHQHRQCPAPITTLPPLSLLHPHVCPEPKRSLDAPSNVTARLSSREFRTKHGGIHGSRKDRQFVYSRFRPWRTCRDDAGALLTCISFLGDSSRIAVGGHAGELKVFDSNSNTVLESYLCHQSPLTLLQSHGYGENQLLLSSSAQDVRLWDACSVSSGPKHSFEEIKAARFSNSGLYFAALRPELSQREIRLYDTQTCNLDLVLKDTSNSVTGKVHPYSLVHFNPSDSMLLWNGVLWDRRGSGPIHRFDQFTDYGGGGFHPAGNEVIINSEVWDLRNFRLLRSVPSLDQTVITFNASGDVIYAILRRNLEDVMSAFNSRRMKHPLFSAFRTIDAVNYSEIATTPVDRCVLDFATEPTDSFVGLVTMDDQDEMYSSARVYEIGRRKPTDDDSDPDDAESEEEEDDADDDDDDSGLEGAFGVDGDSGDDESNDDDSDASDFEDDEDADLADFMMGGDDSDGNGIVELLSEDDDDGDADDFYGSGDDDIM